MPITQSDRIPEGVVPDNRYYRPYGATLALMTCRDAEVLLSGPAGTGKSRGCLEKLHLCAEKYPGMRGLIVRKTRESLTESALVTLEDKVLPFRHSAVTGAQRRMRQAYRYPNGSEIIVGGMDKPSKVMSTEYDIIYVQEAIELTENDWESLTTRLRNGVMPYQQIISDTNPDTPQHWLKLRCDVGRTTLFDSRHEDNPTIWDMDENAATPFGLIYLSKLDNLTGPRKERLRYGKWVQAEGVIYEGYDRAVHLIDSFEIPPDWPRYWVIDFGYTNPFVCQWWAKDPDGRLYRYREFYRTHTLVEDAAREILDASKGDPKPALVLCDHDAEDRATLERHLPGLETVAAKKDVSPGIQAVATRLKTAGDGKPRIFFLRDSLLSRDPLLTEAKKPACSEEEIEGYVWNMNNRRNRGEEPLKENDHGMDAMRYLCINFDEPEFWWQLPSMFDYLAKRHESPTTLTRPSETRADETPLL